MITNVSIDLSDKDRLFLADLVDGKTSARKIKRAEIVALCQQFIGGLLGQADENHAGRIDADLATPPELNSLYQIDPEDRVALAGKPAGFVRGWNLVKRSNSK